MRRAIIAAWIAAGAAVWAARAEGTARLDVSPRKVTVGERLTATLTIDAPAGARAEAPAVGSELGGLSVSRPAWSGPTEAGGRLRWTWTASLAAFETGEIEIPSIEVKIVGPGGSETLRSAPVKISVESVLEPAKEGRKPPDLADLKPPATVPPDWRPLRLALLMIAGLLAAAGIAWWLHRRYASRWSAVPFPDDPFHREAPHVWAYAQLQRLLERRLAEEGRAEEFFAELSRIVKTYLGGRYRVDLLERTTSEVGPALSEAGAPDDAARRVRDLLGRADLVKFAKQASDVSAARSAVEEAYRIVDATKPSEAVEPPREKGAA